MKKSYLVDEEDIKLTDDIARVIAGSNVKVYNMYLEGVLDTLLLTGCGDIYCTRSLGRKSSKPSKLVELFKLVSKCYGGSSENLVCLEIGYSDNSVIVSSYCDDTCDEMYMLFFDLDEYGLSITSSSRDNISDISLAPLLEEKLIEVIEWGNSVCPVPLYSIEYYASKDKNTSSNLGTGNFYIGLSEANISNGVSGIDTIDANVGGEYALVFLEE